MSRIATFSASQSAIMDLMRTQRTLFETQQQLTTGKKASDLKGVGHQAESLSAARAAMVRAESFQEAGIRATARLDASATALESLGDAASDLRTALTSKNGSFLMLQVEEAYYASVNALNTKLGNSYIFAGTRSDSPPIEATELSDLLPMGSAAEAFLNNDRRPQVRVDQNINQNVGMLASDVGGDLFASFKAIADFNAGVNGPFTDPMTDAQETLIRAELQNVLTALDGIHTSAGQNGIAQSNVDKIVQSHADRHVFLEQMLGSLEDVDMAEAATRFQQAQTALDVSAKTFATLSQVSLLPFLR
jgi:flagellar hook-associated protein 3 FlgL